MSNIDLFKNVNDKYEHIEGDKAFIRVAQELVMSCNKEKNFISRYGGDEFIIVYESHKQTEAKQLIEKISHDENALYDLKLSIGYARCNEHIETISKFIDIADKELYNLKKYTKYNLLK